MTVTESLARRVEAQLAPDPARVVAKLFLPGEELPLGRSRAGAVIARVLALPEDEVERVAASLLVDFSQRHRDYFDMLADHASMMRLQVQSTPAMSEARSLVLGASFTAEYAVEGAALCNPSAVLHPDQSGLVEAQARIAISLRGIGEGHISSVGFTSAVVGPGPTWTFEPRSLPVVAGSGAAAYWQKVHLRAVLTDEGRIDGLARSVLAHLPAVFTGTDLEHALAEERQDLLTTPGGQATVELLRRLVASAYAVGFPADLALSQQVLLPSAPDESNGMEDARFVRFTADDGSVEYRATYTAFDGRKIAPRLLISPDLRTFQAHRLAGPAARNKGMALFPRMVGGRYRSLLPIRRREHQPGDVRQRIRLGCTRSYSGSRGRVGGSAGRQLRTADRDRSRVVGLDARRRADADLLDRRDPARHRRPHAGDSSARSPVPPADGRRAQRVRAERRLLVRWRDSRRAAVAALRDW